MTLELLIQVMLRLVVVLSAILRSGRSCGWIDYRRPRTPPTHPNDLWNCCASQQEGTICAVCVCVWTIWRDVKTSTFAVSKFQRQGDHPCTVSDGPTKRPQYMRISRLITVTYLLFHVHFLQWDLANPRTTMPFSNNLFSTCPGGNDLVRWNIASSSGLEILSSWSFSDLFINLFLSGITGLFFARRMHSTSEFAEIVLSKCVVHAGFVTVAWTPRRMLV